MVVYCPSLWIRRAIDLHFFVGLFSLPILNFNCSIWLYESNLCQRQAYNLLSTEEIVKVIFRSFCT